MPVRIGTGTGAVDPSALRVAGVEPTRIMVGTGSAAVEVWSARYTAAIIGDPTTVTPSAMYLALSHIVPRRGRAVIIGGGIWDRPMNTRQVQVRVNGVEVANEQTDTDGYHPAPQSADLQLEAGDVVELWARHSSTIASRRILNPRLDFT